MSGCRARSSVPLCLIEFKNKFVSKINFSKSTIDARHTYKLKVSLFEMPFNSHRTRNIVSLWSFWCPMNGKKTLAAIFAAFWSNFTTNYVNLKKIAANLTSLPSFLAGL